MNRRRSDILVGLVGVLSFAVVVGVLVPATKTPRHIQSITVDNLHQWPAGVECMRAAG